MERIEHQVRERAYYIWEDEGRVHGRAEAHWLRAEAEVAAPTGTEILVVQAVAPAASRAPSPAKVLKPKAAGAKSAAVAAKTAARAAAEIAAKPASKAAAKAPKAALAAKAKVSRAAAPAALH